ncbi:MAG: HupE/UreJ family protein [Gammaproteobacteria bacterium]
MLKRGLFAGFVTLLFWAIGASSWAHALDQSYVFLNIEDTRVSGRVDMMVVDINAAVGINMVTERPLEMSDLEPYIERIESYLRQHVSLSVDGSEAALPVTEVKLKHVEFAQYVQFHFAFEDLPKTPEVIDFDYSVLFEQRPDHRGLAVIETNWKTGTFDNEKIVSLVFEPGKEKQSLVLEDASFWTGLMAQIRSGIHHIWIGIDHILFLLALLLPAVVSRSGNTWESAASFKDSLIHVVKIVTVFTVAHTITLSLAALGAITLSSRLIESVIAISIAIAAFDILRPIFKRRIWFVVFVFGLFHGFGFASVLGELGIPANYMVPSLLGFNVGVEIGQLAIVGVLFPILFLIARFRIYTKALLPVCAVILIVVSMYWFIERAFEYDLPAGAIVNAILGRSG